MSTVRQANQVIQQEFNRLRRFAFALTGAKADAEDLLQNTVVKILKKGLPDYDDPVPWMLTICKNLWIDEVRSREVRLRAVNEGALALETETERMTPEGQIDVEKTLAHLASLPENNRQALSLVAVEGLSYAEAAEVLEVPVGTIMSRVSRARASMVKAMQKENER